MSIETSTWMTCTSLHHLAAANAASVFTNNSVVIDVDEDETAVYQPC